MVRATQSKHSVVSSFSTAADSSSIGIAHWISDCYRHSC